MEYMFPLLEIVHVATEPSPSLVLSVVSIIVGVTLTVLGWYIANRTRPSEKAALDLQALSEYRDALEKRIETLEDEKEKVDGDLETCRSDLLSKKDQLDALTAECAEKKQELASTQAMLADVKQKLRSFEDRLLESRLVNDALLEQRNRMAKEFGLPLSVSDKVGTNGLK